MSERTEYERIYDGFTVEQREFFKLNISKALLAGMLLGAIVIGLICVVVIWWVNRA